MTSKLTREENVQAVFDLKAGYTLGLADVEILKRVARMALAAMDSEPVGTLSVRAMSYSGKKFGTQFGFVHSDAAMKVPEGDYPLYRHAQPAPVVPVVPDEMTPEQAYEIGDYHGDPVDVFARGANWMLQHIIDSTLAAAQQSPGSEPATVPGKWIPVSERIPENDGAYLCWDKRYVTTYAFIFGAWQANQFIAKNITHWMPLPAAPQEVQGE
ncbi:Eaa1 [Klebsiella michiganensis]|nr:Eaa1 [Klebsiella michiganensis]